jgi:hypothetical protein
MKKIILFFSISLVCFASFGQASYAFKVIANKGTNQVKSGEAWLPLKPGASLKDTDELLVGENAYLGLVSSGGKPIELKKAGNYKVSVLTAQMGKGSSVLNKYTDFILSSNAEGKKNRLSATGAVHRATETNVIKVMLPESQNSGIYNTTAIINWEADKAEGPFIVTLRNMFEDELFKVETEESGVQVDLSKFANENAILVEVKSKSDPKKSSKPHTIRKLSNSEQARIKQSLSEIMDDVNEQTALNQFILAGFYEENKLLIDAITAYEEAIKLAPDVTMYQEAYEEFLIRNGLKK